MFIYVLHSRTSHLIFSLMHAHASAASQDFTSTSTTVIFAPSDVELSVNVPITDDALLEGSEQFFGVLSLPNGGPGGVSLGDAQATAIIQDNDGEKRTFGHGICICYVLAALPNLTFFASPSLSHLVFFISSPNPTFPHVICHPSLCHFPS